MKNNKNNNMTRKERKALTLSTEQKEIIRGSILGDLHAEKRNKNGNTRLQFHQTTAHLGYINHLYDIFSDFTGSPPVTVTSFDNRPNKQSETYSTKFNTLSLPCFNEFRAAFYNLQGIKIIPAHLMDLLTIRGLAYFYMDDGYFNPSTGGFYFCTESFT